MKINKLFLSYIGIASIGTLSTIVLTNCSDKDASSKNTILNNKEKYSYQEMNGNKVYTFQSIKFPEQYANKTADEIKSEFGYQEISTPAKNFTNLSLIETWIRSTQLTNMGVKDNNPVIVNFDANDFNYSYLPQVSYASLTVADSMVMIAFQEQASDSNGYILYGFVWMKGISQ